MTYFLSFVRYWQYFIKPETNKCGKSLLFGKIWNWNGNIKNYREFTFVEYINWGNSFKIGGIKYGSLFILHFLYQFHYIYSSWILNVILYPYGNFWTVDEKFSKYQNLFHFFVYFWPLARKILYKFKTGFFVEVYCTGFLTKS